MLVDPMKEAIFEVLLDLVEGPFQPCGKGGDLLMLTLGNLIKLLHQDVE